ncbi:uncharacterized protein N7479_007117, partial [Penicillium vulpinum]|uniref:uncharacterized protein n=1 Tax=Penicillium vulpinum TaxID=29845 RepID=UPI002546A509
TRAPIPFGQFCLGAYRLTLLCTNASIHINTKQVKTYYLDNHREWFRDITSWVYLVDKRKICNVSLWPKASKSSRCNIAGYDFGFSQAKALTVQRLLKRRDRKDMRQVALDDDLSLKGDREKHLAGSEKIIFSNVGDLE